MPDFYWVGALICQTVVIAMTGKRLPIEDFLPVRPERVQQKQTPEEMVKALRIATGT